jgi:Asp-tRNA(Asn)/Glu-tRNA(Gln) amidotransferase A subunit family amidase
VPCGTANGMPVGLQIVGGLGHDLDPLRLGIAYQASLA